jgi:hypothetical protein
MVINPSGKLLKLSLGLKTKPETTPFFLMLLSWYSRNLLMVSRMILQTTSIRFPWLLLTIGQLVSLGGLATPS